MIADEAEYEAALARAWSLMDAAPGSADETELEVASTLIEEYEKRHYVMGATA